MRHAARRTRPAGPPVGVLVAVMLSALLVAAAVLVRASLVEPEATYSDAEPVLAGSAPADVDPSREVPPGLHMLRAWDGDRAAAWAAGDVEALGALYVDGSAAGRRDVAALAAYVDRGLRVEGLRTQVLEAEMRSSTATRRVMAVTDRVAGGRVVGDDGESVLPADAAARHVLTWERVGRRWLLAEVEPA